MTSRYICDGEIEIQNRFGWRASGYRKSEFSGVQIEEINHG